MQNGTSKAYQALIAVLVVGLAVGGFRYFMHRGGTAEDGLVITGRGAPPIGTPADAAIRPAPATTPAPPTETAPADAASPAPKEVVVHVAGDVKKPGVYHLPLTARADDALKAAGGAKPDANLDAVNLAAHLEDGKQLYIPTRKEQPEGGAPAQTAQAAPSAAVASVAKAAAKGAHSASAAKSGKSEKLTTPGQGTVNINTASAEELQKLPGVGPAMAQRILDFRKQNGRFTSPDQLMDVSGIGEKKYARMQPFVRVH